MDSYLRNPALNHRYKVGGALEALCPLGHMRRGTQLEYGSYLWNITVLSTIETRWVEH